MIAALALALLAASDAGTTAKLTARPVELSADQLTVFNQQLKADYRGHAKAIRDDTTITCDTLTVFYDDKRSVTRLEANGHVEAHDHDRTATGDSAVFDNTTGLLTVHGSPTATQGQRSVTGSEILFHSDIDKLEVRDAKTVSEKEPAGNKQQKVEIDAEKLLFEADRHLAVWSGHVKAKRGTTRLQAPELTARYDDAGAIKSVEARGGVEVTDGDRWARGQRADFDNARGVLVVTGKPEARQGKNRMKGTKVTFVSGTDALEVENATTVIEVKPK